MAPAKSASPILGWRELPRASRARRRALERRPTWLRSNWRASKSPPGATSTRWVWSSTKSSPASAPSKIGRASCREKGEISGGAGSFKKKKKELGITLCHHSYFAPTDALSDAPIQSHRSHTLADTHSASHPSYDVCVVSDTLTCLYCSD